MDTTPTHTPPATDDPGRLTRAIGAVSGWSSRHRTLVIVAWVAFVVACVAAGTMTGQRKMTVVEQGVGESGRAARTVDDAGLTPPATEMILVRTDGAASTAQAASALTARLRNVPQVADVVGPIKNPDLVTDGGRTALLNVTLRGPPEDATDTVVPVVTAVDAFAAASPGVEVRQAGDGSIMRGFDAMLSDDLAKAQRISLPLTLLILLLTFGALVAASVPLIIGITSAVAALGLLGPVSQLIPAHDAAAPLVVLIGLAVGVDYSLFFIRRERVERAAGADPHVALATTMRTVGRAVVVAGLTVMIALAGLLISGMAVFTSMAIVTIIVVAIAVTGSVTVLPALLAALGDRVDRGRLPFLRRRRAATRPSVWGRFVEAVTHRPVAALVVGVAALGILAAPALTLRTADTQMSALPTSVREFAAYHEIDAAFPGSPMSTEVVVTGRDLGAPAQRAGLDRLGAAALRVTGGAGDVPVRVSTDGRTAALSVPTPERGAQETQDLATALRGELRHTVDTTLPGARVLVGGGQIAGADFSSRLTTLTPVIIGAVLTLAFLLITVTFRSGRLALLVVLLNTLSVGAAYGILALVFQHEWAEGILDFTSTGTITNWVPLFTFVILFGLSMDYTILVLERIREARLAGRSPREAAAEGVRATAGSVTSAALVMVVVLGMFALMRLPDNKQLGIGLASAIALDATLIRAVLLPAVVTLLGGRWRVRAPRRRPVPIAAMAEEVRS